MAILFQRSRRILAILVEGHPRNISLKLFRNQSIGPGGDVIFKGFPTFSFDGHFVQRSGTALVEGRNRFGRGSPKEHLYEIILKLVI